MFTKRPKCSWRLIVGCKLLQIVGVTVYDELKEN